jgi:hypothetical protein
LTVNKVKMDQEENPEHPEWMDQELPQEDGEFVDGVFHPVLHEEHGPPERQNGHARIITKLRGRLAHLSVEHRERYVRIVETMLARQEEDRQEAENTEQLEWVTQELPQEDGEFHEGTFYSVEDMEALNNPPITTVVVEGDDEEDDEEDAMDVYNRVMRMPPCECADADLSNCVIIDLFTWCSICRRRRLEI